MERSRGREANHPTPLVKLVVKRKPQPKPKPKPHQEIIQEKITKKKKKAFISLLNPSPLSSFHSLVLVLDSGNTICLLSCFNSSSLLKQINLKKIPLSHIHIHSLLLPFNSRDPHLFPLPICSLLSSSIHVFFKIISSSLFLLPLLYPFCF